MAHLSVSRPRRIGARGHSAPPSTSRPAPPAAWRTQLFAIDRLIWVWLYGYGRDSWRRWCWSSRQPDPVVPSGIPAVLAMALEIRRPSVEREVRDLIRQMSGANPLWGAPRIHGELLKLGIEVSQATVAKYMVRRRGTSSQNWRTFLRNHTEGIAAIDVFVVASASFRLLYVVIVLAHDRRKIVRTGLTEHPTAAWISRQVTDASRWDTAPRYLLRDRDASYGSEFRRRVEAMNITEVITAPRSPWQNAYVERVIGSIRRECLDHLVIFNERHLRRVMSSYVDYYQRTRTHLLLDKDCPDFRPIQHRSVGRIVAILKVGGLRHRYERVYGELLNLAENTSVAQSCESFIYC